MWLRLVPSYIAIGDEGVCSWFACPIDACIRVEGLVHTVKHAMQLLHGVIGAYSQVLKQKHPLHVSSFGCGTESLP